MPFEKMKELQKARLENSFYEFDLSEIEKSDRDYPAELIAFWKQFGYAFISEGLSDDRPSKDACRILTPEEIDALIAGTSSDFIAPGEGFAGRIPFLHVGEMSYFCVDRKGAVYGINQKKICKTLSEFINKLADRSRFFAGK